MTATTGPRPDTGWTAPRAGPLARLGQRRPWAPPVLVGSIVGLATAYTAWQDPNQGGGFFPGCPLKEMTGLDCPGCGGTRAVHALAHGDLAQALDHNVVLAVVLPVLAVAWALWLIHGLRATIARRRGDDPPARPSLLRMPRMGQRGWLTVVALLVAFAVVRNISAVPVLDYLSSEAT